MQEINHLISCLEQTPLVLSNLLREIPEEHYREHRKPGSWCIHEQVCHLVDAQQLLIGRFKTFRDEEQPVIGSHDPTDGTEPDYMAMDMQAAIQRFPAVREEMVNLLKRFDEAYWQKQGEHQAFEPYSTRILLRHVMNVDYTHLFSIEQLGLTKEEYAPGILTIL